ncbi:MAG: glutaredoxin domain-containing protein [bacterium]|nr:glutaredoxin domain-containing protein [bacterium]
MKVTIYTINDCKFSQAEKDYLKTNGIAFEEKNVEQNRDYLTEMLGISENFAGTPVTKIEKDDGTSMVLKGFTQEEFDKELGRTTTNTAVPVEPPSAPVIEIPSETSSTPPPMPTVPAAMQPTTPVEPVVPAAPVDMQTEPISLSDNMSVPKPVESSVNPPITTSSPQPIAPAVEVPPMDVASTAGEAQVPTAAADPLNSVLESLQSQVSTSAAPSEKPSV